MRCRRGCRTTRTNCAADRCSSGKPKCFLLSVSCAATSLVRDGRTFRKQAKFAVTNYRQVCVSQNSSLNQYSPQQQRPKPATTKTLAKYRWPELSARKETRTHAA